MVSWLFCNPTSIMRRLELESMPFGRTMYPTLRKAKKVRVYATLDYLDSLVFEQILHHVPTILPKICSVIGSLLSIQSPKPI